MLLFMKGLPAEYREERARIVGVGRIQAKVPRRVILTTPRRGCSVLCLRGLGLVGSKIRPRNRLTEASRSLGVAFGRRMGWSEFSPRRDGPARRSAPRRLRLVWFEPPAHFASQTPRYARRCVRQKWVGADIGGPSSQPFYPEFEWLTASNGAP